MRFFKKWFLVGFIPVVLGGLIGLHWEDVYELYILDEIPAPRNFIAEARYYEGLFFLTSCDVPNAVNAFTQARKIDPHTRKYVRIFRHIDSILEEEHDRLIKEARSPYHPRNTRLAYAELAHRCVPESVDYWVTIFILGSTFNDSK